MKILVVDDQLPILEFLADVLQDQGYEVLTASSGNQAMELYREHRPSFTLTDISMPGMSGLDLLRQIKTINNEAVVMLMTGAGSESFAIEALRNGAINYFTKPVDIHEICNTLSRYEGLANGYEFEHFAVRFLHEERLSLKLENDLSQANHAVQMVLNHCRAIFPLSELFTLRFGLYEMIVNAIEHGNLGITYDEKSEALEHNRLAALLEERSQDPMRALRRVHIDCAITAESLVCTIRDEGEGFDHSGYSRVEDADALFEELGSSLHGRGILLTSLQFDAVTYNDRGNEVTIYKRVPTATPVQA